MTEPQWTFRSYNTNYQRTTPLHLYWEISGDPITDDYTPDDITAAELWRQWRTQYPPRADDEAVFGPDHLRIWWFVQGDGVCEAAPFQDWRKVPFGERDFLLSYSWPLHAVTGEPVQWCALPVVDKLWRPGRGDKGGFIQQVTGWKPGPLQAAVNIRLLERAAGLAIA